METKPVFFISDVLSNFIKFNKIDLLKNMFNKIIIPPIVQDELNHNPLYVDCLNNLIKEGFIEIRDIKVFSDEFELFIKFVNSTDYYIGDSEATVLALTIKNDGIIVGDNLKDLSKYIKEFDLSYLTTVNILHKSVEMNNLSLNEANKIWNEMAKLDSNDKSFHNFYKENTK